MAFEITLSPTTQRREMEVISRAWDLLTPLDTAARFRVLEWLGAWARSEAPPDATVPF